MGAMEELASGPTSHGCTTYTDIGSCRRVHNALQYFTPHPLALNKPGGATIYVYVLEIQLDCYGEPYCPSHMIFLQR